MNEASAADTPYGRQITSDGWFVLNLTEAMALRNQRKGGASFRIESREQRFKDFGVNLTILWPGDPNALYHAESVQEGFLVLSGRCKLIVEEQERELRQWDYVHCPAWTRHVFIGTGEGPCAILMIGARPDDQIRYPVSELAARYGASASQDTDSPEQAYADWPGEYEPVRLPWPLA